MTPEELVIPLTNVELAQLTTAAQKPDRQLSREGVDLLRRLAFERDALKERLKDAVEACRAALRYDASICGRAIRNEVTMLETGDAVAEGADLDALYFDWQDKAKAVVEAADKRGSKR